VKGLSGISQGLSDIYLMITKSTGESARNIWDSKLAGFGMEAMEKKSLSLHGQGKKLC
jgi:hypothetical protein